MSELCAVLGVEKPARIKDRPISRLCSKPGHVTEGSAFFGIIWNGSTELADVRKKGAIAIITNRQVEGLPCIVVDDICEAYCRVYAHIRDRFQAKTIAVTATPARPPPRRFWTTSCAISLSPFLPRATGTRATRVC